MKPLDARPKARRAPPEREASAGARLPYARHVDDVTIATRDGMLMQVIRLAGLPFETADTDEINYRKALRDGALRALASSRFAIYHHVIRREVAPVMEGEFNDDFSRTLDDAWRERLGAKKLYVNELYLTLVRRPLQGRGGLAEGILRAVTGARPAQNAAAQQIEQRELDAARDSLLAALAPYGARLLTVYDTPSGPCSEPLEFLASLYNGPMRPVLLPRVDLGEHIPYRRVSFGAETVELSRAAGLDRSFSALLSVKDYPPQTAARHARRPAAPAARAGHQPEFRLRRPAGQP